MVAFTNILVSIDGSSPSIRALDTAIELAALSEARLTALAVEGPLPRYGDAWDVEQERQVERFRTVGALAWRARRAAAELGIECTVDSHPEDCTEVIVRYARERRCDLVVVGRRRNLLTKYLFGSFADRVAHHAPCPVVIVK